MRKLQLISAIWLHKKTIMSDLHLNGMLGKSGGLDVFLGFAQSSLLHSISIADVLDEESGKGYQRRFNEKHSLDFRKYIQERKSTTIPLTFNLRPSRNQNWTIVTRGKNTTLVIDSDTPSLYQVDCQHRLGFLSDLDVELPFMVFIGLTPREEMRVFNTINGKAKGLSSSLLDFHDAKLALDLGEERPELFIALRLNDDEESPWFKNLDLGGKKTTGMNRRASLRTMQKGVKRFLHETEILTAQSPEIAYKYLLDFWVSITVVLDAEWLVPRKHFITKGIGVYSLNSIAADIYTDGVREGEMINQRFLMKELSDFVTDFDWSNEGPLKGLGGGAGVQETVNMLRKHRTKAKSKLRLINRGR